MTAIKICGLCNPKQAIAAAEAGADMVGLVFAPSRRRVTVNEALRIGTAIRARPSWRPALVGVFVNEEPEHIVMIANACNLDMIQLSGDEDINTIQFLVARLKKPVIKAVRFRDNDAEQDWFQHQELIPSMTRFLVDAHAPGIYGGSGLLANWPRAAHLAQSHAIILAGGLNPDNVKDAITCVNPWGVDVSSGVETAGTKDSAKMKAFVAAVRAADHIWK